MSFPPLLAHGTLGALDELIFIGVAAIFLIMMGVSWVVARRSASDEDEDAETSDAQPSEVNQTPDEPASPNTPSPEQRDHFPLA
ncbi:MAG: hypothetical protein U0670_15790 [Anaerolineae bacterium]